MTSGSDDFFLTLNVWSFKSRHVELGTFEIPVVGGGTEFVKSLLHSFVLQFKFSLKTFVFELKGTEFPKEFKVLIKELFPCCYVHI